MRAGSVDRPHVELCVFNVALNVMNCNVELRARMCVCVCVRVRVCVRNG